MEKKNLWNDAAKYGAIVALAMIVFEVLANFVTSGFVGSFSLVTFVLLLYFFTKQRTILYGEGENGYGYGQCLLFIFYMMLFAGVLIGAFQTVAINWLFVAKYEAVTNQSIVVIENMGFYTRDQIDMITGMTKSLMHSPLFIILSAVVGSVLKGLFFGLFIAALTKRKPNLFSENNE